MFEDRNSKRTFSSAPQSITSLVAAFLEPTVTVLTFVAACLVFDERLSRTALAVCLLVFALTFPGRNRFRDSRLTAAVDIATSWAMLVGILALCAYATRSLDYFGEQVLIAWVVFTPILQWLAVRMGMAIVWREAARPHSRRSAIVVGAGALGVKVAQALKGANERGIDFVGYFDDRTDERVHA
jgi:putative colanic acid biosysnthesis UDP-glucose lipid carrier transferase